MKNTTNIKFEEMLILWGFIFFVLGALGVIQIGLLEGLSELILLSLFLLILGILILLVVVIVDKVKAKKGN